MLHNMWRARTRRSPRSRREEANNNGPKRESIALCQTAVEEMQFYGSMGWMCEPKDLHQELKWWWLHRNQNESFYMRPHAELNAILISRNLCHNYFLIISHSARSRCRISHCVPNGLKFNNKTPSSSCSFSSV